MASGITPPGMQQRYTGYDFGKSNRFQSAVQSKVDKDSIAQENELDRTNQLEILSAQLKSQKSIADERNILTKSLAKSRDDLTREQIGFAEAEKIRDDKFRSDTLDYRAEEKIRADEISLTNTKRLDAADERDFKYQTEMLASRLITAKQNSMVNWGVDVLDDKGSPLPTTVVDPKDKNKTIPNPILVKRGANFSVDGTRLKSTKELVAETKAETLIEQTLGLQEAQYKLEVAKKARTEYIDPLLFESEESRLWGFDEEDALDNLKNKAPLWGETVKLMSVLPDDNAKKIYVLSSIKKLRNELRGEKYSAASGGLALESNKYGQIRSGLANSLDGYIQQLGGK